MFAPNFTKHELTRSRTAEKKGIDNTPNQDEIDSLKRLSWFLQALKIKLSEKFDTNVIININSGFRSPRLNTELFGSATSAHMRGLAADITCSHLNPKELAKFIESEMKFMGYDQVILEFNKWVHIGLAASSGRLQPLTSTRVNGQVHYLRGIV